MKKFIAVSINLLLVMGMSVSIYAIQTSASCSIRYGQSSATSDSIGLSRSARFYTTTAADSIGIANVSCYAAWAGWPYTVEGQMTVPPGKTGSQTVTQSRDSNFKITIWSTVANLTKATGKVISD